jgi:ribose 5-phosphate isomerase A
MSDEAKQAARDAAARAAVERLEEGMTVGLGSGRALWRVMELIAERWPGGPPLRAVAASSRTAELAAEHGIELVQLDGRVRLDLAVDGADEIDAELGLIKGGGGALLREKLVISAAESFLVVAEADKRVERLGDTRSLPVEVVRFACRDTRRRLLDLLDEAAVREDEDGEPVLTDEGHYLLDCELPEAGDLHELARRLKATVGVVEHGLFLEEADVALLGRPDGGVEELTRA